MFGRKAKSTIAKKVSAQAPLNAENRNPQVKNALESFGFKESSSARKNKKEREDFENEKKLFEAQKPTIESEAEAYKKSQATKNAQEAKELRNQSRQEGREDTRKFFSQDIEGLSPQKRAALQYEANKGIQRGVQSAHRKLLGEQGQKGIRGQSGVGYAQQRDLLRQGEAAKGQAHRDLDKLDSDLAMKKLAAIFTGGEGEAAQSQLDRQLAMDEMNFQEEKRRQRQLEDQYYRLFSRV